MRLVWRGLLVAFVFVACGFLVSKLVVAHAVAGGTPAAQVRLARAMAVLFAGGGAATIVLLVLAFGSRK